MKVSKNSWAILLSCALFFLITECAARMELAAQDAGAGISDNDAFRHVFLQWARKLGVTYIRDMASIGSLDPCRGVEADQNAARIVRLINDAKKYGMKVQLVLTGSATSWSEICLRQYGSVMPMSEWANYVRKYVPYFYKFGVRRFAIWNEPNHPAYNCAGTVTPGATGFVDDAKCNAKSRANQKRYLTLYKTAYKTIKSLQKKGQVKKAQIWFGEFAGNALEWTKKMLKGQKLKAHGFSWHPYQYCSPPEKKGRIFPVKTCKRLTSGISWSRTVQGQLKKWAQTKQLSTPKGGKVPMYMTEFGYHCQGKYKLPESIRKKFYVRALKFASKAGARGFVLYHMFPTQPGSVWDTSLLKAYGYSWVPTDSYRAIHKWATSRGYKTQKL